MSGLVLELQRDALDNNFDISNLLRKALVVSRKLGVDDIEKWLRQELNGYTVAENELPEYRQIYGSLKVQNPMRGLIPFHVNDPELADYLSSRRISHSISELESLVKSNESGTLDMNFHSQIREDLMRGMDLPMEPVLQIGINQIHKILDSLRNEVLNWALELEQKGIKGEGMTFSNNEKQAAESVTYKITNNIGSMQNSQLQQVSDNSQQSLEFTISNDDIAQFVEFLKSSVGQLNLKQDDQAEIEAEIATIDNQLASPKPKKVILAECLKSVRNIIEGSTGSLVATGLLAQLGAIISTIS
ncbi:hypothetical protein HWQ46_01770 [Shewanella sp. D64]|uniref:AbiTii domain-containing protein n=1 Tax=unclassified Shewanella TaxID=196818 RepID=UPI0022BA43DB|nr:MULTISPECIES: hypothetical protein [unclassified Shewanella]MEC4724275.1 hypothetical protein [Shewanella sp. D64]MEC4738787.1 hypothetical protein [Shewanella sp. E94]WBJ97773.1 hypothetical protein HWQ47_12085 [Shewanella sp. MTB7]